MFNEFVGLSPMFPVRSVTHESDNSSHALEFETPTPKGNSFLADKGHGPSDKHEGKQKSHLYVQVILRNCRRETQIPGSAVTSQ
jgi:hypothetical protein